ncbi:MAG: hypothetical protein ABJI72_14500 [Parasphingorhabdus sp.]|uniref:hypothetical protein n=1 Tax=Parasphingorhabdus sp. TaxID=2709688 RepID=UPI0032969329
MPNPNPDRASATLVDSVTPLDDLPCFMAGASGVGMVLDLERVFLATGNSCAGGSRFHLPCARARQERALVGRVCWARWSQGSTTSSSVGRPGLPGDVREPGGYGVHILGATDWVGFNRRASFPMVTTEGGRGSRPLSAARMTASLQVHLREGRPAGPFHDAFLSSGRLRHQILGRDGGGRYHENGWF